jgi:cytochrome b561
MNRALKTLRAVQWSMLASVLLYGILGEIAGPGPRGVDPAVSYVFTTLSVAIIGIIFVVRRTLVLRAAASLATHPDDSISLNQWRTGYLTTYALCEALAIFGIVLRFLGGNLGQSLPYYVGGFALLFFFKPREPVSASAT